MRYAVKVLFLLISLMIVYPCSNVYASGNKEIKIRIPEAYEWVDSKDIPGKVLYGEPETVDLNKYIDMEGPLKWEIEDSGQTGVKLESDGRLIVETVNNAGKVLVTADNGEDVCAIEIELLKNKSYCYGGVIYSDKPSSGIAAPREGESPATKQYRVRVYDQYGCIVDSCNHKVNWYILDYNEFIKNPAAQAYKEINGVTIDKNGLMTIPPETKGCDLIVRAVLSCWRKSQSCQNSLRIYESKKEIVLKIGSYEVMVNGKPVINDSVPVIIDGVTFLPIRVVAENLGASVSWDNESESVGIVSDGMRINVFINKKGATVNEESLTLPQSPFLENGRTYLPVRFVSENLGAEVLWNGEEKSITISK